MIAIATMRLKLTMMEARLKVDSPTFSRNCAMAVSKTTRPVTGAARKTRTVRAGTNKTAPNNKAPIAA